MGEVPRRRLGHTEEMVSMIGLGGYHLVRPDLEEAESIRIVRAAMTAKIGETPGFLAAPSGETKEAAKKRPLFTRLAGNGYTSCLAALGGEQIDGSPDDRRCQ